MLEPARLSAAPVKRYLDSSLNRQGERFMRDLHPEAELAPRDIVRRIPVSGTREEQVLWSYLGSTLIL